MKKDIKLYNKKKYDLSKLKEITDKLLNREPLDPSYKDHELSGKWENHRELHIQGDWLLIYRIFEEKLILKEFRMGTHSELFKCQRLNYMRSLNRLFEEVLTEDNTQNMMTQWQQMYNPTMQQQQQNYNDVLRLAGQGNNNFFADMGKTVNKGAYDTAKTVKKIQNLNNSCDSSQNNSSSSNQNGQSAPNAQNAQNVTQQTQTNSTATSQQPQTNSTTTSQSQGNSQKLEKNIGEIKKDTEEIKKLLSKQQESLFEKVFLECLFEEVLRETA